MKAILFDLDGTLLDVDMDEFLERYLHRLSTHLSHFVEPKKFTKNLWASTGAMVHNDDPNMTNQEAFIQHFYTWIHHPHEEVWPYIDDFYDQIFPALQGNAASFQEVGTVMNYVKSLDLPLVIATNPIFPRSAILHRMHWAGVDKDDFALITSYENMHYTKPNPKYYLEVAEILNVEAKDCIMIGNDPEFDIIPAAAAGMNTFLVDETCTGLDEEKACGRIADIPLYLRTLMESNPNV